MMISAAMLIASRSSGRSGSGTAAALTEYRARDGVQNTRLSNMDSKDYMPGTGISY